MPMFARSPDFAKEVSDESIVAFARSKFSNTTE